MHSSSETQTAQGCMCRPRVSPRGGPDVCALGPGGAETRISVAPSRAPARPGSVCMCKRASSSVFSSPGGRLPGLSSPAAVLV